MDPTDRDRAGRTVLTDRMARDRTAMGIHRAADPGATDTRPAARITTATLQVVRMVVMADTETMAGIPATVQARTAVIPDTALVLTVATPADRIAPVVAVSTVAAVEDRTAVAVATVVVDTDKRKKVLRGTPSLCGTAFLLGKRSFTVSCRCGKSVRAESNR